MCRQSIAVALVVALTAFLQVSTAAPPASTLAPQPSLGESSLIDRETGRIYWRSGPGSVALTSDTIFRRTGKKHLRATALTSILALVVLSAVARWVRDRLKEFVDGAASGVGGGRIYLSATVLLARCAAVMLCLPKFDTSFVALIVALYLIESYACSTRRFLENALVGPAAVEDFVEGLRNARPSVVWKVRCFHYERRRWMGWLAALEILSRRWAAGGDEMEEDSDSLSSWANSPLFARKVITHKASEEYEYASWSDKTKAGLWKRAWAPGSSAPFAKISLSKTLVLSDSKARDAYFAQQSKFVAREGQKDEHAEFSTSIQVDGFKAKALAIRPTASESSSSKLFRIHLFWVFTALGLTVPFRIWFSQHCDELCLSIVKETSTTHPDKAAAESKVKTPSKLATIWASSSLRSLLSKGSGTDIRESKEQEEEFRRHMQEVMLYEESIEKGQRMVETLIELQNELVDAEESVDGDDEDAPLMDSLIDSGERPDLDSISGPEQANSTAPAQEDKAHVSQNTEKNTTE